MRNNTHRNKNGPYLISRLKPPRITDNENRCNGFQTFESYYMPVLDAEMWNMSEQERARFRPMPYDNILITYSTLWGNKLSYKPKGQKWTILSQRIRYNDDNRFPIFNDSKRKTELSAKYRSAKGSKNKPFFNGLFSYYIKPLLKKGHSKAEVIEILKPKFKKIAITEGEFKAFIGCKNGFPTIGVSGIHNAVKTIKKTVHKDTTKEFQITTDANFLPELLEFMRMFEVQEVMLLMDNDAFDNQHKPNRAKSFFGAVRNFWFAIKNANLKMTFAFIKEEAPGKGLDDLILAVKWSRVAVRANIEQIPIKAYSDIEKLQFSFAESTKDYPIFFSGNHEVIQLEKDQKLSDGLSIEQTYNKIVIAPTGSGKTYLVNTCDDWMIIVCPTTGLCENVANEYGAYYFNAKERLEFDWDMDNMSRKFIAVTYDSFKKLTTFLAGYEYKFRVFIDEAHNFTLAANYRLRALNEVVELSKKYKSTTLLTGTFIPCFHPSIAQMPIVEVKIPRIEINANLLECADVLKSAQFLAQESIKNKRFPLILFNSKKSEGRLGTLKAFLRDYDFAFFNADTKQEQDWKQIASKGIIASNYQGMCVTSVLKEGNNIYNEYDFDIIIIGNFHSSEIEQFCRRPRKPKSVTIYKLVGQDRPEQDSSKSIYGLGANLLYKSIATCNELNTDDSIATELIEKEFLARQAIAALPIKLNQDNEYETDYLRLSNFAFQLDTTQENRNLKFLQNRLAAYGINLGYPQIFDLKKLEEEAQDSKISRQIAKENKEQEFERLMLKLEQLEIFTHSIEQLTYHSKTLSPVEKEVYKRIKSLSKLMGDRGAVLKTLKEAGLSKAKFTLLKRRQIILLLKSSKEYMRSNRKFAIMLKAMYDTFKEGDRLTGSQLRLKLIEVLELDKGLDIERLKKGDIKHRNNKAVGILKLFFEFKKKKIQGDRFYVVGGVKRDKFIINQFGFTPLRTLLENDGVKIDDDGYPNFFGKMVSF